MSLSVVCTWTLVRTVIICLLAWPIIVQTERWLRDQPDSRRPIAYVVILAPFLFPELLVGYAFREVALTSTRNSEWLCAILLLIRIVPIGVIALIASPPSLVSPAAIHCRYLSLRGSFWRFSEWWQLILCFWYGSIRRVIPAMSLMSLVAFQEFELAALLQTASWTDWFIAAQRVGLDRNEMLMQSLWPFGMQLPLLAGAIASFSQQGIRQVEQVETELPTVRRSSSYAVAIYLVLALLLGCLIPLFKMAWNLPSGLSLLVRQPTQWTGLGREMIVASAINLCAGVTTWFAGRTLMEPRNTGGLSRTIQYALILPGLIGSLLLGLAGEKLFQQPWLRPFYDTPIPWVVTLIVWLLPRAVLLQLWLAATTRTESVFLAEILNQKENSTDTFPPIDDVEQKRSSAINRARVIHPAALLFRLRDQPRYLAMGLLCYWAYLDLSTAYLLAPTGMASGLVRLYNFMHFGRSVALSAESFLYFGIPLFAAFLAVRVLKYAVLPGQDYFRPNSHRERTDVGRSD